MSTDIDSFLLIVAAGVILNLVLNQRPDDEEHPDLEMRPREVFELKLDAIGYGFAIPAFFITSGMKFDLDALLNEPSALLKVPLFLGLFLLVRGLPAILLYADRLPSFRDRAALALFSATQLPLVVAITTIGVETDRMRSSTAAALVGAAMLSTLIFPLIATRMATRVATA